MRPSDYAPLIEKVQARFASWTVRHLSFAGRLQLLHSVISSMINFWASIFILPSSCLKRIENLCNAFLWSGSASTSKAKISWETVCTPKSSGGLGLRRLHKWNNVLCLKLLWLLFTRSGSLWVSWVTSHLIRDSSLWDVNTAGSWLWRKLLKLRVVARPFILCHLGDGESCLFWHDNWTGFGPLILLLGTSATMITGIPSNSTVKQAIGSDGWLLPSRTRNPVVSFLRINLPSHTPIAQATTPDRYSWTTGDQLFGVQDHPIPFSARRTFDSLWPPPHTVPWHKTVWFSQRIPKHAFHFWVMTRNRLPTRDRIHRFSPASPTICVLCQQAHESRDHLFFECPFSFLVLSLSLCATAPHRSFAYFLQWLPRSSRSRTLRIIAHLLVQATSYILWKERNARIHTNTGRTGPALHSEIKNMVKGKLLSITPTASDSPLQAWFGLNSGDPSFQFSF